VNDTNEIWKWFIDHTARRADVDNEYRTMDLDFMESVIYCFDKIYKDNLVYKGFKVQRYCPSCATPLANNEVSEGYEDKTDTAITVKFQLNPMATQAERGEKFELTEDGVGQYVRAIIKNDKGEILQIFNTQKHNFEAPGGKVNKGENAEQAITRELKEEVGVEIQEAHYLGSFKEIIGGVCVLQHTYEVKIIGEPQIKETDKHTQLVRVGIEPSENALGFGVRIEGNIMEDTEELMFQFWNIYTYIKEIPQKISADQSSDNLLAKSSGIFLLARTTTPRTLPSNMFLATGENIDYTMVYDFASKEYYILATNLIKKYYKNPEDYLPIRTFKGKELQGLHYTPLFDYITKSEIKQEYKNQFFQVLNADFVSTEDGTGIVHIAPTFGEEDFGAVAKLLGAKNALEWLFMPVNEYGEFDEQIYDYTGESVLNINKTIIERLKTEKNLIKSESITHSYPHCRRCHTPLISKAMSSRFIKEQEMNAETRKEAEKMNFVPESVKNRFVNGLQQAPDRNIARNRYRGSPLPIWQNVDDESDTFSVGTLEEIYQLSRSGSKNITKHILIRHGRTYYNEEKKQDNYGDKALLNEEGLQHSEQIRQNLQHLKNEKDLVIVLSPMERVRQTIVPFLNDKYGENEVKNIRTKYEEVQKKFRDLRDKHNIISYLEEDKNEYLFEIGEKIFVDFRITEVLRQTRQDQVCNDRTLKTDDETIEQIVARSTSYLKSISKKFPTSTIISVSHGLPLTYQRQVCKDCISPEEHKKVLSNRSFYPKWYLKNNGENAKGNFAIHYRDNNRQKEVDLHKPYVDNYWFVKNGKTYKRIPEVMDCRFESGSMPFGQEHYIGQDEMKLDNQTCKLSLIRHGQSMCNKKRAEGEITGYDYRDDTNELTEKGKKQAQDIVEKIEKEVKKADTIFYVSLLSRAIQTIEPYFEKTFGRKLTEHPKYLETKKRFDEAMKNGTFRWQDFTDIEIEKNIYLDARIMERKIDTSKLENYRELANNREAERRKVEDRINDFLEEIKKYAGKQVIASTHRFPILQCKRYFDGITYQLNEDPTKTEVKIRNGRFYDFLIDTTTGKKSTNIQTFTADFIAEGLDQTRGRFRTLHIL
jgi:broad specificity phosphatase PhoE